MREERLRVLKMLEAGQINAKEAADLLAALDKSRQRAEEAMRGRWLRVRVTDLNSGKDKINVTVPVNLVSVALRMGARLVPKTSVVDVQRILEAVESGHKGKVLEGQDVEDGERVEIFVE